MKLFELTWDSTQKGFSICSVNHPFYSLPLCGIWLNHERKVIVIEILFGLCIEIGLTFY